MRRRGAIQFYRKMNAINESTTAMMNIVHFTFALLVDSADVFITQSQLKFNYLVNRSSFKIE